MQGAYSELHEKLQGRGRDTLTRTELLGLVEELLGKYDAALFLMCLVESAVVLKSPESLASTVMDDLIPFLRREGIQGIALEEVEYTT